MSYRGQPKTSKPRTKHGSFSRGSRSKSPAYSKQFAKKVGDNLNMSVPEFVAADFEDESRTVPEYIEQADLLERAGFPEEAMYLRGVIALQEASHRDFFSNLQEKVGNA